MEGDVLSPWGMAGNIKGSSHSVRARASATTAFLGTRGIDIQLRASGLVLAAPGLVQYTG